MITKFCRSSAQPPLERFVEGVEHNEALDSSRAHKVDLYFFILDLIHAQDLGI